MLTPSPLSDKPSCWRNTILVLSGLLSGCFQDVEKPVPECTFPVDKDFDKYTTAEGGGGDCDDQNPLVHPGAVDEKADGIDQNCDGLDGPSPGCIATGAETCDGIDNDCDGQVDDTLLVSLPVGATVALVAPLGEKEAPLLALGRTGTEETPGTLSVYGMDGQLVVSISGEELGTSFGQQVASGRDYDGDGIVDLVVSAPFATTSAGANHGVVLVLPGPITASTTLSRAIFRFEGGELDGQAGTSIAMAPDLDGDQHPELLIGHYRHMLLFSGVTGTRKVADASALFELNTGGGAWHFATTPDGDGDGREELAVGLSTYDGGRGLVMVTGSKTLESGDGTYAIPDALSYQEGDAGAGMGEKLTRIGDHLWWLSNGTPTRDDGQTLAVAGINLFNLGDVDGDGAEDPGIETIDTLEVQTNPPQTLTGYAGFQSTRDLGPLTDINQDGQPELVFRNQTQSGVLDLLDTLSSTCNQDHDGVSSAEGDCADTDPLITPLSGREICDTLDNDCDGIADAQPEWTIDGHWIEGASLGNGDVVLLDKDGNASVFTKNTNGFEKGGTVSGGLASGPAQLAGAGDPDGDGQPAFLLVTDVETILYRDDLSVQSEFVDGSLYRRGAQAGNAGDVDGDGLTDSWLLLRDKDDQLVLGIWHHPPEITITDDADTFLHLPASWLGASVGSASVNETADISKDGRDDLVFANENDGNDGNGRVSIVPVIRDGDYSMDTESELNLYGDPGESLGRSLVVGDFDGDGTADTAAGGTRGARIITGLFCTRPGPYPIPTDSLALVDLDQDGTMELLGSSQTATVWGNTDAGSVWVGRYGEEPTLWRAGNAADLLGIQLFGMPEGLAAVAQEEVRIWGGSCL